MQKLKIPSKPDSTYMTRSEASEDSRLGLNTVMRIANEANAVVKVGRRVLIKRKEFYEHLDQLGNE